MTHVARALSRALLLLTFAALLAPGLVAQGGQVIVRTVVGGVGVGGQERPVVAQFDADKDGRLNTAERAAARTFLAQQPGAGRGFIGGRGGNRPAAAPGVRLAPGDVASFPRAPLYDAATLRTFFIEFENPDWEAELVAFNNTD